MHKYLKYGLIAVLFIGIVIGLFFLANNLFSNKKPSSHQDEQYTCSMHPQIIRNEPGNCPICGMKLIKKVNGNKTIDKNSIDAQLKPTNEYIIGDFEIVSPIDTAISSEIKLPGIIAYNPNSALNIAAWAGGRIEKMYVNYKFQKIQKGQILFEIYSPELLTEQQNYLFLVAHDANNAGLISAAEKKMLLYGMTTSQIAGLRKSSHTKPIISVYSTATGIIAGTESMTASLGISMQRTSQTTEVLSIKEGDYVQKGQIIFKLLDTKKVWGIFNVLQGYNQYIYLNQLISIITETAENNVIQAKINFIETELDPSERTNRIRVYLNNTQNYPVGLRLTGILKSKPISGMWLPKTAIVTTGNKQVVFVKIADNFKSKAIETGIEMNEFIQVLNGLLMTDKVAKNAGYLIDSESFINTEK
ncbi:MAG: efflux RND transporter periplasmic adaptor subunit [bacterium]|nr:efflux RND transporter periplasmic adaptor subunit [bacterium]